MEHFNKLRILLVDDEAELTTPLSRVLQQEGYAVDLAQDGEQGLELARRSSYHLLILDWMMPKISGIELCQALRQQGDRTPVLFLTAKDTVDDRVEGLDAGADDYLVKPFELRELLARVRALLRRPTNLTAPDTAGARPALAPCSSSKTWNSIQTTARLGGGDAGLICRKKKRCC